MSSYFSNTEYHLEHRREYISGFHNNIQQGNRSALGNSVSFNLYNSEDFIGEASLSGNDWEKALGMTNDISGGMFDSRNADTGKGMRNSFDNKFSTGLLQEVTSKTFSEFDNNLSNSLRDSRNSLKYLTGEAYRIDPSNNKAYASQVVFENIFGSPLKKADIYLNKIAGRDNYYQDQSYEYSSAFVVPVNVAGKDFLEMRGQETLDRLVYSDLFGVGLVPVGPDGEFTDRERSALNNRFNRRNSGAGNTITDLDFIRSKSMTNELVSGNVGRAKRIVNATDLSINSSYKNKATSIMSDMKYQTRPGILPFVSMIEGASEFITIDTFQFQNKSISDVLASKVFREIVGGKEVNTNFKVTMMVGSPVPGDTDGTSAAIFGPNILEIRKMQMLQEAIIKEVRFKLKGKSDNEINDAVDAVNSNFVIKAMGPAHHRKVYITDQVAVLGSINLTSPVGDSVFKAGSNFEFMMMFHKNNQLLKDREDYRKYKKIGSIDGENANTLGPSRSLFLNYQHKQKRLDNENDTNYKRTLSALMYEQVVEAQQQQYKTRSDQANVKYATDIMYTLKATVDLLHAETGRKNGSINEITESFTTDLNMRMVLDQSYLLHVNHLDTNCSYDNRFNNDLSKETGEMGKFSKGTMEGNAFRSRQDVRYDMYRDIQRKTFTLIALGITKVAIDSNNLKSGVIEPTWNYLNDRLQTIGNTNGIPNRFMSEYGGSISKFVQGVTRSDQNFGQKIEAINTALGIDSRTDSKNLTAYQILAITSGNITGATVPRQHAKAFTAYREFENKAGKTMYQNLVSYSGSANLSMSNMGVDVNTKYVDKNGNDPFVTDEMGVVFINREAFGDASKASSDNDFKDNIAALNLGLNNLSDYSMLAEEENYENKQLSKTVVMSYNQLMYGNRIESGILPSIEGLPYWARQFDTGNLMKLENTLKDMSKGLGDAMSISRKYDRFGTPLSLEVNINPGKLLGMNVSSSRLTYTITMLQGDGNQPGPVFFAGKEGKLIYNSNFTNNTGQDLDWKYGNNPGKLKDKQSAEMSSIDNTTSIFATMITELSYRQAISNPASKLVGANEGDRLSLLLDFTTSILGTSRNFIRDTTNGTYIDGLSYSKHLFDNNKHKQLAAELDSRFSTIGIQYLDNTRALAGIDVFERNDRDDGISRQIDYIRRATSAEDVYIGLGRISELLGTKGYEDLALDVLKINGGYNAETDLNKQMRDLSTSILDPYLGMHQANNYGAGVPASKLINYGLNTNNAQAIEMINRANKSTNGILQTLQYARTFARDVSVYSSFGSDYEGNERFYIGGVAEGVSTQNKEGYQLLSMGVRNKFPTDRNSVDILEGVGIGTLISKDKLTRSGTGSGAAYFTDDNVLEIMNELGIKPEDKGMLFNLDPNKPAQINQRIKNALGSRLMYEVDERVADLIKEGKNLNGYRKQQQEDVSSKIQSLTNLLGDNDQAKKYINNYLTKEEVNMATMFDTDVRTVLNESAYNNVVAQRNELFDQFKDVEGGLTEDQTGVLNYLFRLKMISYSSTGNTIGSVVGGRRDRAQFVILQLNGGYSDHFYTNPNFRTSYYASASTTTNTGIKASMLDARTFVGSMSIDGTMAAKDGFVIKEGDMFLYNRELNKVVQMVDDGNGGRTVGNTYVGGNGSSDYLIGQIENFNFLGRPVSSVKQRSTSNRPGEDSVQLILTAKRKEGASPSNNTIDFEVSTLNMIEKGSGRREEGTAASILFKGVSAAIDALQFSKMFEGFKTATTQEGRMSGKSAEYNSAGVSSVKGMNVQLSDVYGLINPNNLKSGFFVGHGAGLLTMDGEINSVKGKMADLLVKQNNKILAAALVSQFGLDIVSKSKLGKDDAGAIAIALDPAVQAYKQSAISGEYGTYIRMLEMQRMLTDNTDIKKGKISVANRSADNIFGSVPQFILDDKGLVGAIRTALLEDGSGNLSGILEGYVNRVKNNESGGYIINSSDVYTRGVTAILTALDMFGQLKQQTGDVSVVTDWLLKTKQPNRRGTNTNDSLVEIAAIIGGDSNAFNMSDVEKDELAERMGIFLQNNYGVMLQLNILPSPAKDPLGKNLRAKTELQHLLNPLEAQTKQFRSTGGKNNLAYVLGTVFAASETGLISLGMADSKAYLDSIDSVKALDIATLSGFFGHRFMGIYYNANSNSKDLILEYKKIYSLKIRQGFDIEKHNTYFNDKSMTMAEAKYVDKEKGYTGEFSYVKKLSQVGQSLVQDLRREAIAYNLEESKGMGTDITQPKLNVLIEMGSRTFNILLPEIIGDQRVVEMTGDVNTVFSNEQSRYLFMPGAELLNQIGSSFGDFVSDIVGKSINMYSYFTPGTAENDMMIKLMSIKEAQKGNRVFNANLSREEAQMLNKLYNLGDELLQSIIEASSDTLMQKATAGHGTEFDGYVSTPIPNLALNYNMNVMPEFVNERYGAPEGIAKLRGELFDVTADALNQFTNAGDHLNRHINAYKKSSDVQKFVKTLGITLDYQKQMLVRGMSNVAGLELKGSIDTLDRVHNAVSNIQKNIGNVKEQKAFVAEALAKAQDSFSNIQKNLDVTGAYDQAYVASYIVANMQFANLKIGPKANEVTGHVNDYLSQTWIDKNGEERSLQKAIYLGNNHEIRDFIHNSTEKNKYSMGLDLVNFYGKQLEGAIRGKHSIYSSPNSSIRELIDNTIATSSKGFEGGRDVTIGIINSRIQNLTDFIDNFAPTAKDPNNEKSRQEHFIAKANRQSVDRMITDMEKIKSQVEVYEGNDKGFLHYSLTELGYIHNRLSELDNMQNQSWRSAPFGSTESHLGTLMAVRGVAQFNEMMDSVAIDDNIVRFDTVKGKSLSMFSGLSFLTSNLGDFDGDNYITLIHKITEKIDSIDKRQLAIKNYETQLANPLQFSSSAESYEKIQKALEKEKRKLNEDGLALKGLQIDVNKSDKQSKMAKDVASYMGIDSRFFLGSGDDKGFRTEGTIAIASMVAMLEQGKGLYSGMQGVSSDMSTSVNDLFNLNLGGINAAGLPYDKATLDLMIDAATETSNAAKIATALGMTDSLNSMDPTVQEEFHSVLRDAMTQSFDRTLNIGKVINDQMGEETTKNFYAALVSKFTATSKASDALSKVMNSGHGIGMSETTYDVLTKTLGKAGSDVLGKTYNTLLGTFVADSPIVSLYHMLDNHSSHIADQMNKNVAAINPNDTDAGTRFMANLQAGYDRAQQLQGWNKSVQQMLRDSIKLKGDSKSVMNELTRVSEEYSTADEERRREIIDFMASKIGPGAGMKGLMDLNTMIHKSTSGSYGSAEKDYNLVSGELEIAKTMTGYKVGETNSDDALIKYKVANSLRSITTMFNFEKNFGELKVNKDGSLGIDNKSGSNRALEKAIGEGLAGFLGRDSDTRSTTLLLAEHATGSREMAAQLTNDLYNKVDAINQMGNVFKGENRSLYNGYKDQMIADEMNKFALAITTADEKSGYKGADSSSGIFGSMLKDHIGLDLDSEAAAKLNSTRKGKAGLSTASLLVINHHASITQTKAFIGDHGEELDRFIHLNNVAQKMQKNISKGLYETGTNLLGGDLFNAAYRLMAQGKLSTDGGSVMGRLFKAVNDPNMSNADAMGKMLGNFSSDAAQTNELTAMYEHLKHVEIQHDSTIPGVEGLKESVGDLIERQSKKTAQGFKLQAISEVASALHASGDMSGIHYEKMAVKINEARGWNNKDETRGKEFIDELLKENGALLGNLTEEGKDYFKPHTVHRGSDGTSNDVLKANIADKGFNILGPALLSMIGGAVYGSSKDGAGMDMAGVVGGTLTLMGYNMPGVDAKSKMAGAVFRSRAYANPDEDTATALAKAAATEVSIGLVGTYVTPKLTSFISNNIVAPVVKNNIPIAESGVSAIVGSFVGAIAMNMLNSTIQQSAGLLKNNFNAGDNNLNAQIAAMERGMSDIVASRSEAELNPMDNDMFIQVVDKLDMPPLVVGVWATDGEMENLRSDTSIQLSNGEEGYV